MTENAIAPNINESTEGIECKECKEVHHYYDEMTFLLGGVVVHVDEQSPDWHEMICNVCAEEQGLI